MHWWKSQAKAAGLISEGLSGSGVASGAVSCSPRLFRSQQSDAGQQQVAIYHANRPYSMTVLLQCGILLEDIEPAYTVDCTIGATQFRFSSRFFLIARVCKTMAEEEPFNLAASEVQCCRQPSQWGRRGCRGSAQLQHLLTISCCIQHLWLLDVPTRTDHQPHYRICVQFVA